jgi:hypothetical protein
MTDMGNRQGKQPMSVEKCLSDVYYDEFGTHIWNRESNEGGSQLVADVRGWGRLQNEFATQEEASKFQDEVGRFIAAAIRDKIQNDKIKQQSNDQKI